MLVTSVRLTFSAPPSTLAMKMPSVIRNGLFAATFLCSTTLCEVRSDELTGVPPPLPLAIGREITADLVNVIFLFDRLASAPPRATTPNFIARISDPSSALYPDYLDYEQGRINRSELESRLPHVAMLGDSLTQNFHFSSMPSFFGVPGRNGARTGSSTVTRIPTAFSASTNDSNTSRHSWRQNTTELAL